MNRLLVLHDCPQEVQEKLRQYAKGHMELCLERQFTDAEYIIGEPTLAELHRAPKLRCVQMTWAGADRYTNAPDFPKNVALCTASGAFGVTIAEHALALALALCRRLPEYAHLQQDAGCEKLLFGGTAVILGTGDLGLQLSKRCRALGMKTIGVRRKAAPHPDFDCTVTLSDLPAVLPQADVVFGCLPDSPGTRHLLNADTLALLKSDALIINVGRGSLIDTEALTKRLAAGLLWGAGLDVTEPEPLPKGHPLRHMENVILSPHVAGIGFGHLELTEQAIWDIALDNLRRYVQNLPLRNVILPANNG